MSSVFARGGAIGDLIFIIVGLGIEAICKLGAEVIAKIIARFK